MAADEDDWMSLTKNMEMVPLRPKRFAGEDEVLPCPMQVVIYGKQDRCQRTMKSAYVHVQKCGGFGIKLFFHELTDKISQWLPIIRQDKVRREILEHARCGANCCGRSHNQASYECKVSLDNLNSIMACKDTVVLSFQEWGQLKDIFFTGKKSSKKLEQLLKSWLSEKPWDGHQFEVDIPPDQCITHGKAVLCVYPRWLVLSKVYTEKELKEKVACHDQNLPEEEDAEEKEEETEDLKDVEAKLPFRVPLVDLRTFGPNHGTGFYLKDVNDRQYFLRCEKGEDINSQIDEYRDDLIQQLAEKFQTASNVDQATMSQVLQRDGFLLNVGVFAEKPQPGKDWCVYVFMTNQKTDLEALVEKRNLQLVCPPRPVAISTDMRCPKLEGNKGYRVVNPEADEQLQLCYEALIEERRGPNDAPNMSSYMIKVSPMKSRGSYANSAFHGNMSFQAGAKPVFSFTADFSIQNETFVEEGYPLTVRKSPSNPSWLKRRERLVEMLSCRMPFNNNWEMLVEKIGLDYTALLAIRQKSQDLSVPAMEVLLWEWEETRAEFFNCESMCKFLDEIGRRDVILYCQLIPQRIHFKPGVEYSQYWRNVAEPEEVAFRLHMAVFADNPSVGGLWSVMIAISGNKDIKMLNKVVKGYVVCPVRSIAIGQGEDMNLTINIKSQGWSLKGTPRNVVLPHKQLQILTDNQDFVCHKEVTILHEESNKYQFQAQIVASLGEREVKFSVHGDFKLYEDNSTNGEPIYELHSPKAKSKWLPVSKRLKLCQMLDWNIPLGNNWKMMVEKIGLDFQALKQIEEVSYKEGRSPTELLLQDWEARQPTHFTQDNLYRVLDQLERKDVIMDCGLRLSSSLDNPLTNSSPAFNATLRPDSLPF
ncbi:Hypp1026 [Branchiostoma lanceolatum]|uniref:Hypp1026 protein n=1 Tax=Branchiostoma lanceolatum TaxID=7740 RepID=A0A8J9ZDZ4_BRALA|nr:Hypp1026 [Branchiostoma lanceolatum]